MKSYQIYNYYFDDVYHQLSALDFLENFKDGTTFRLKNTNYYFFCTHIGSQWFYYHKEDLSSPSTVDFEYVFDTVDPEIKTKLIFHFDIFLSKSSLDKEDEIWGGFSITNFNI